MKPPNPPEIELFAAFVHGGLSVLHILGSIHNWRRGNWIDFTIHTLVVGYDITSTVRHAKALKRWHTRH